MMSKEMLQKLVEWAKMQKAAKEGRGLIDGNAQMQEQAGKSTYAPKDMGYRAKIMADRLERITKPIGGGGGLGEGIAAFGRGALEGWAIRKEAAEAEKAKMEEQRKRELTADVLDKYTQSGDRMDLVRGFASDPLTAGMALDYLPKEQSPADPKIVPQGGVLMDNQGNIIGRGDPKQFAPPSRTAAERMPAPPPGFVLRTK